MFLPNELQFFFSQILLSRAVMPFICNQLYIYPSFPLIGVKGMVPFSAYASSSVVSCATKRILMIPPLAHLMYEFCVKHLLPLTSKCVESFSHVNGIGMQGWSGEHCMQFPKQGILTIGLLSDAVATFNPFIL